MEEVSEIRKAFTGIASLHSKQLSEYAVSIFEKSMQGYSEKEVLAALNRCLKELPRFPTIAEIIERIDDGHPGVEEAWGLVPRSESESTVWTDEIREAFFSSAWKLIYDDPIAARMAFKEVYPKLVFAARAKKKKAFWQISLGHDPIDRIRAAKDAINKNRLTHTQVEYLLSDHVKPQELFQVTRTILKQIPKG